MDNENKTTPPEEPNVAASVERLSMGDAIPVKVRASVQAPIERAAEDARQMEDLLESENEVIGGEKPKRGTGRFAITIPPRHHRPKRAAPTKVTDEERTWAALAHASAFLTVILALTTGGILSLITVFIPLAIYLIYRDKSEFVAHHALQAFAVQVIGTIGFGVLLLTVVITWIVLLVISFLLILLLVGLLLFPLVVVGGILAIAATLLIPLGMLIYSMIAALQAWNGNSYSYPWIGDWVDDQLFGQA